MKMKLGEKLPSRGIMEQYCHKVEHCYHKIAGMGLKVDSGGYSCTFDMNDARTILYQFQQTSKI